MLQVTPHLNFRGHARSVLEFYQSVFGGEVSALTYQEAHNVQSEGGMATAQEADQIMWGQVLNDTGFRIMAYDVPSAMTYNPGEKPVYISVQAGSTDELAGYWTKLKDGASVMVDLGPAPWGAPMYGMLKDQFGVIWVMDVQTTW